MGKCTWHFKGIWKFFIDLFDFSGSQVIRALDLNVVRIYIYGNGESFG